jgi:hypothetical protein
MQANLEEQKRAIGSGTACPRIPRTHVTPVINRRSRSHETLIGSTSSFSIPPSYLKAATAQYNEIPSARFALFIDLSRYSTINNGYSRNSENAAPIAQYNEMAPASSFPPLPLRAPVENLPVGLNPQASSHLKQGCASPGKVTQGSREKTSASLACKASFLRPVAIRRPFARSRNIRKLPSGNVRKIRKLLLFKTTSIRKCQALSGNIRLFHLLPYRQEISGNILSRTLETKSRGRVIQHQVSRNQHQIFLPYPLRPSLI